MTEISISTYETYKITVKRPDGSSTQLCLEPLEVLDLHRQLEDLIQRHSLKLRDLTLDPGRYPEA